uniref:Uncharacterized protein n=1 Tax=Chelydra serpentina TaxID=8475 RepID=A0A8C3T7M9_CHESE
DQTANVKNRDGVGAGFTAAGIATGTVAAKMMSAAAVANGGGVAAGSAVAVLQSIGKQRGANLSLKSGFTGAGIAAGSMATKMMSAAAVANGGGVAAGSAVATLQSIGKSSGH